MQLLTQIPSLWRRRQILIKGIKGKAALGDEAGADNLAVHLTDTESDIGRAAPMTPQDYRIKFALLRERVYMATDDDCVRALIDSLEKAAVTQGRVWQSQRELHNQ